MKTDTLNITVLPDGTIKIAADRISQPSHASAEAFVRECARLAGGSTTRKAKTEHGHSHAHTDEHHHH